MLLLIILSPLPSLVDAASATRDTFVTGSWAGEENKPHPTFKSGCQKACVKKDLYGLDETFVFNYSVAVAFEITSGCKAMCSKVDLSGINKTPLLTSPTVLVVVDSLCVGCDIACTKTVCFTINSSAQWINTKLVEGLMSSSLFLSDDTSHPALSTWMSGCQVRSSTHHPSLLTHADSLSSHRPSH